MAFPYQEIPDNVFRCGHDSPSIHHVAKEGIRIMLVEGLRSHVPIDDSTNQIVEGYVDRYYNEKNTGDGYLQFSYTGSSDPTIRYTFQSVTNFLKIAPDTQQEPLTIACIVPKSITGMVQHLIVSRIYDRPKDSFFEKNRVFLPASINSAYDAYSSTPKKQRAFSLFSQSLYCDPNGFWQSPYTVYTVQQTDPVVPNDPPGNAPQAPVQDPPTTTGNDTEMSNREVPEPARVSAFHCRILDLIWFLQVIQPQIPLPLCVLTFRLLCNDDKRQEEIQGLSQTRFSSSWERQRCS